MNRPSQRGHEFVPMLFFGHSSLCWLVLIAASSIVIEIQSFHDLNQGLVSSFITSHLSSGWKYIHDELGYNVY